jgi:peptidoglycan hydrolase FlgJ
MNTGKITGSGSELPVYNAKNKAADDSFEVHLKNALAKNDDKDLKNVCQEFEGILLNMMYQQMKATVPESGFLPDDPANGIFQSMLDDKLVEEASKSGSLGLADLLYKQLRRQT